ncbi:hypothetical protein JCM4814A_40860 [Streptomyces phaeofaciens JCM 4814]|uniref:SDR family NAD(P)-dependent oxidoreductase n=1 Tax=Streptomyces phaeofaciens TaxID=68254 RepID=A0A918LZW0_9ACTN|nr:SDR family NAD(P)-dependent oxidoreductase [Streptomyces phaeofaciens]GGT80598.1 hypothetical protein GCM10010226_68910 [Streptomyces phaeofaciens]
MTAIALVTGANRGLGHEVARQLLDRGRTVLVTARSQRAAEQAAARLGTGALPQRGDPSCGWT